MAKTVNIKVYDVSCNTCLQGIKKIKTLLYLFKIWIHNRFLYDRNVGLWYGV